MHPVALSRSLSLCPGCEWLLLVIEEGDECVSKMLQSVAAEDKDVYIRLQRSRPPARVRPSLPRAHFVPPLDTASRPSPARVPWHCKFCTFLRYILRACIIRLCSDILFSALALSASQPSTCITPSTKPDQRRRRSGGRLCGQHPWSTH
jgi:hypothetical protein